MKALVLCLSLLAGSAVAVLAQKATPAPDNSPGLDPRSRTLQLAGAFTNDGFRIRDGYFSGTIEPNKPKLFEVNLYAGNQYWFCAGALPPGKKLSVAVYDENGKKVDSEIWQDEGAAAAGIVAPNSGRYFVQVTMEEGQKTEYCFLYAYK